MAGEREIPSKTERPAWDVFEIKWQTAVYFRSICYSYFLCDMVTGTASRTISHTFIFEKARQRKSKKQKRVCVDLHA